MSNARHPAYSERNSAVCPSCGNGQIEALPPNNPDSLQEWFRCVGCDHLWSQRRDRTEQGDER